MEFLIISASMMDLTKDQTKDGASESAKEKVVQRFLRGRSAKDSTNRERQGTG